MKKNLHTLAVFFISVLWLLPATGQTTFYDPAVIQTIEIEFKESNWDEIMDNNLTIGDGNDLLKGKLTINKTEVFNNIGVRYKGNSSYKPNQKKNPLHIDLNYLVPGQDYQSYNTIKLSNGKNDPTLVREVFGYEIARNYMPASKANYAKVYINGEYIGIYTNVEAVNKDMLKQYFSYDNDSPFFKGDSDNPGPPPSGCPPGPSAVLAYLGQDSACYKNIYDKESKDGWKDLVNLCDTFNNNQNKMEKVIDVDRLLWFLAILNVTVNLDAPINIPHNFYIYQDQNHRFNILPWDFNETFGVFKNKAGVPPPNNTFTPQELQELPPLYNADKPQQFPLIAQPMANPLYKRMYLAHFKTILTENFSDKAYLNRITQLQQTIEQALKDDPNKLFSYQQFTDNVTQSVGNIIGISELMEARITHLLNTPEMKAAAPNLETPLVKGSPKPFGTVYITANAPGASTVFVGYRDNPWGIFTKLPMFDDGAHEDGAANDGNWGVALNLQAADVQYYVYAENNEAGIFSPARAEWEFYNIATAGDVVINEIVTNNVAGQTDANGEFDDWIELHNNTAQDISLKGYTLSDNSTEPYKWAFPDNTTIPAKGYLIVWADNNLSQQGLHANFKLSATGEEVILYGSDKQAINKVIIPSLPNDIAWGRLPNGSGEFVYLPPTFAAQNQPFTGITPPPSNNYNNTSQLLPLTIWPNPTQPHLQPQIDIELPITPKPNTYCYLYNMIGQNILTLPVQQTRFNIDISQLQAGLYIMQVTGNFAPQKVVVVK